MISQGYVDIFEEGLISNTLFPCLGMAEAKIFLIALLKQIKKCVTFICSQVLYNTDLLDNTDLHDRMHWPGKAKSTHSIEETFKGKEQETGGAPHAQFPINKCHQSIEAVPSSLGR